MPTIQRKQTLFLLGIAIVAIVLLFLPFYNFSNETSMPSMTLLSATGNIENAYYLMVINNMVVILSLVTIFLYKKRPIQFKLANLLVVLNVFITGLAYLLPFKLNDELIHVSFGAFLPLIGAILGYFAAFFIKKDELLVRSADRIR